MLSGIHLTNLWMFYVLAYAIALPVQEWANHKRGEPFDDPEFLLKGWTIGGLAMVWAVRRADHQPVRAGHVRDAVLRRPDLLHRRHDRGYPDVSLIRAGQRIGDRAGFTAIRAIRGMSAGRW